MKVGQLAGAQKWTRISRNIARSECVQWVKERCSGVLRRTGGYNGSIGSGRGLMGQGDMKSWFHPVETGHLRWEKRSMGDLL